MLLLHAPSSARSKRNVRLKAYHCREKGVVDRGAWYLEVFEQVMNKLRAAVKQLEEDELFEQTAVTGADIVLDDPTPSTDDIDTIMQSLMGLSASPTPNDATGTATAQASARFTTRSETVTPQWGAPGMATSTPWGRGA